ncbi:MAG: molybdopterin-dependent oxidoreductase [Acidobacteria bacterium]|nr:molybdopterin-dependent oxidoreductase [Acidobacteriota bacterium]
MEKKKQSSKTWLDPEFSRRDFLKVAGTAAAVTGGSLLLPRHIVAQAARRFTGQPPDTPETAANVRSVHSACLGCRSDCGIKARVENGILTKIGGNPYHPTNMEADEIVPYATDPDTVRGAYGRLCPKGQAGVEILYNPFRVRQPLKRVGPRGSGQWRAIEWDQALTEIVEGGNLFGEGQVDGLRVCRDLMNDIDPNVPELGKRANQVLCMIGRMEEGQTHFWDRFWQNCYGTVNARLTHYSVCEMCYHMTANQVFGKAHLKPDINNAQYIIFFGTNPLEANFPMIAMSRKLVNGLPKNGGRFVVVDPRLSTSAARADEWVPIKPGGDIGLAMGMIRWILENRRYNERFLKTPNARVAAAINGKDRLGRDVQTHCSASWLVVTDPAHPSFGRFLRGNEAGLAGGTANDFVLVAAGKPELVGSVQTAAQADGIDLFFEGAINNIAVKSSLKVLLEEALKMSYDQYAEIAGIPVETIIRLARGFTSHGTLAVADQYRGPSKKSDGFVQAMSICILNVLIGNLDRSGGYAAGGGSFNIADKVVDVMRVPGGPAARGIPFARNGKYDAATAPNLIKRDGFPSKRPWFLLASPRDPAWQEVIPSMAAGYLYPIKVFITYWSDSVYTIPAARRYDEAVLKDPRKVPLFIAFDIDINETSTLADYILPEASYLERWGAPGAAPTVVQRVTAWRQPVVGTYDKGTAREHDASAVFDVNAPNFYTPVLPKTRQMEDVLIDIGKRLNLPGVGENAFVDGSPLHTAWDFYKKMLANIVADAAATGIQVTPEDVVRRGGVFQSYADAYDEGNPTTKATGCCCGGWPAVPMCIPSRWAARSTPTWLRTGTGRH